MTDPRLLDCSSQPEIEANLVRILGIVDAVADQLANLAARVTAITARVTALDTLAIVYDANGGTGEMVDQGSPYALGMAVSVPDCIITPPEGKAFKEWNATAAGDGAAKAPGDTITVDAEARGDTLTLYAIWEDA